MHEAIPAGGLSHAELMARKQTLDEWAIFAAELGAELQRARIKRGASQEDVAYAAGLSRYTYQKFEKGESAPGSPANPSLRNIMAIAQVLDVPLEDLLPKQRPDLTAGR
jgi:transcriptional regulator with XRE-family HTH domain